MKTGRTVPGEMDALEKMADSHHTTILGHPLHMDVLPKTFHQIILAAKLLVCQSSMSPQPTAMTLTFFSVFILLLLYVFTVGHSKYYS